MPIEAKLRQLEALKDQARLAGGQRRIDAQHAKGKLTARERINLLLDEGSFQELDIFVTHRATEFGLDKERYLSDSVVTGWGSVDGRLVYVFSQDFTVFGGSLSEAHAEKVCKVMDLAMKNGAPIIGLNDSGGARIQEGVVSLGGYAEIFLRNTLASGVIPQLSAVMGPCAGGAVYSPAITDFIIMVKETSFMFVTGPEVVKTVTHEEVTHESLGGAMAHNAASGVAHFAAENDAEAIVILRKLLSFIPQNNLEDSPVVEATDDPLRMDEELNNIVPDNPNKPYDMHEVIRCIVDQGKFFELQEIYAKSLIIGFARLDGQTVGIVANNPAEDHGVLTLNTCDKQARFIRWCDAFNVPLIYLVDTPGFAADKEAEQSREGLLRTVPKAVFAVCEATVPQITIHIGKNYGPARLVMGNLRTGIDFAYSWPCAQVARINPADAVERMYRREIESAQEPQKAREEKLAEVLRNTIRYPYHAAEQVMVNDLIDPRDTRPILIKTLKHLANKKLPPRPGKKHGLIQQ